MSTFRGRRCSSTPPRSSPTQTSGARGRRSAGCARPSTTPPTDPTREAHPAKDRPNQPNLYNPIRHVVSRGRSRPLTVRQHHIGQTRLDALCTNEFRCASWISVTIHEIHDTMADGAAPAHRRRYISTRSGSPHSWPIAAPASRRRTQLRPIARTSTRSPPSSPAVKAVTPCGCRVGDITTGTMRAAFAQYAKSHEAATIQRCWSTWNVLCTYL